MQKKKKENLKGNKNFIQTNEIKQKAKTQHKTVQIINKLQNKKQPKI